MNLTNVDRVKKTSREQEIKDKVTRRLIQKFPDLNERNYKGSKQHKGLEGEMYSCGRAARGAAGCVASTAQFIVSQLKSLDI